MVKLTRERIVNKIWPIIVRKTRCCRIYPFLYRSYWHYLFSKHHVGGGEEAYYAARPNPGAGIGHQMANWIAGYWWAKQFGLKYAHIPFVRKEWDVFLGFGNGEETVQTLKNQGYLIRTLPRFDEKDNKQIDLQKKIIDSYSGKKVCFVAEQDQSYKNQYGVMEEIQRKFYNAPARKNDNLIYDSNNYNVAVHVRRGDIMTNPNNPNWTMRILSNEYFYHALKESLGIIKTGKDIHIYFFSQGTPDDFPEFKEFKNLHWCFVMSAQQSFLHMVYADLLITSKSSFSYKPALLNKGIKVCPIDFWHGYPDTEDWYLCDSDGLIIKPPKNSEIFKKKKLSSYT